MFLFRRFAPTIPIENSSLSGICSFRSHISEKMFLSLRDLLVSLAHLRENVPLSPGFARFTRTSPRKCSSLSGICSLRSHIPPRLRRGYARCEIKNGVQVNLMPFFPHLAEREGFEPSIRFWRTHAFQACLFSHSSISPWECKCSIFPANNGI